MNDMNEFYGNTPTTERAPAALPDVRVQGVTTPMALAATATVRGTFKRRPALQTEARAPFGRARWLGHHAR
jgi:hypothetical protein